MSNMFQLNYELLESIAKHFKDEGEDIFKLHSSTRQRVQALHKEWIGEAAEKFFEEMDTELLPALQRLSKALLQSQDVTSEIMKIIQEADEETAGFFKDQLSGDDFGAGLFSQALGGVPNGSTGADDFGAGQFEESAVDPSFTPRESAEDRPDTGNQSQAGGQEGSEKPEKQSKEEQAETEPTPAGGGGGSSSSPSQGLQGDLKNIAVGLGQTPQSATAGVATGAESMPDHIYTSSGSPPSVKEAETGMNNASDSSSSEQSSGASPGSIAAGVAGAAAAGKAAKALKDREENK